MDMYAAADLSESERDVRLDDLSDRAMGLRLQRGRLHAGNAIAYLRELLPGAALVVFWGPQEPGDRVSIRQIIGAAGEQLYLGAGNGVGEKLEDDLEAAEESLTRALEDEVTFSMTVEAEFLLPLTKT